MKFAMIALVLFSSVQSIQARADQCQALTKDQQIAAKGLIERSTGLTHGIVEMCQNCGVHTASFTNTSGGLEKITFSKNSKGVGFFEVKLKDFPNRPMDAAYMYVYLGIDSTNKNRLWHNLANLLGCRQTGASAFVTDVRTGERSHKYYNGPINADAPETASLGE